MSTPPFNLQLALTSLTLHINNCASNIHFSRVINLLGGPCIRALRHLRVRIADINAAEVMLSSIFFDKVAPSLHHLELMYMWGNSWDPGHHGGTFPLKACTSLETLEILPSIEYCLPLCPRASLILSTLSPRTPLTKLIVGPTDCQWSVQDTRASSRRQSHRPPSPDSPTSSLPSLKTSSLVKTEWGRGSIEQCEGRAIGLVCGMDWR